MITEENVKYTISNLPTFTDDTLVHIYKCCSSTLTTAEKKLLKPLMTAIEKERKARNKVIEILEPEEPVSNPASANPDDYENEQGYLC